jgi:CRISPR-associated exonuclease Cas4
MFTEDQLLPISALQHLLFCERQCALIHLEQVWAENRFTVEGQHLHRKAHAEAAEKRIGTRTVRGLNVRSFRLGLLGKADVVEFASRDPADLTSGKRLPRVHGQPADWFDHERWSVTPIEYKRGKPKTNDCDRVQLCAQALCLEEMLGAEIMMGAVFYGKPRRRTNVTFDAALRALTESVARRLHALIESRKTPVARREPKCDSCSLLPLCLPDAAGTRSMSAMVDRCFAQHLAASGPTSDPFPAASDA